MTEAIWEDLRTRLRNLRGDMIGQWQGDIDSQAIEHTITLLGNALQMWNLAQPVKPPQG